jgi:hypothetical protein
MASKLKLSHASVKNDQNPMDVLLIYCKDIYQWPEGWEIDTTDIKAGKAILEYFIAFLIEQIKKGKSKKTIKKHAGYLWALGGELIREINENSTDRRLSAEKLVLKYVDELGGPYWRHASSESDHAQYDSVCKQLFKFLTQN